MGIVGKIDGSSSVKLFFQIEGLSTGGWRRHAVSFLDLEI
jgi:hypothetical protein